MAGFNHLSVHNIEFNWRHIGNKGYLAPLHSLQGSGTNWGSPLHSCVPTASDPHTRGSSASGDGELRTHRKPCLQRLEFRFCNTGRHQEVALHGWQHGLILLMALQWQLVQKQSLSHHGPLSTCVHQQGKKGHNGFTTCQRVKWLLLT